jgi:hypothetical protein
MPIKKKTLPIVTVAVTQGQSVFLTIIIGNAQIGASLLKFVDDTTLIAKGTIQMMLLGKGETLNGKTLNVITNVLDTNPSTNKMVVIHEFKNASPDSLEYEDEVAAEGDILSLTRSFTFKLIQ